MTIDELRARIEAAGLPIPEARLEMIRVLMTNALAPVERMDARALKTLEPAVTFDAAAGAHDDRR
jgi:hypothetical protein